MSIAISEPKDLPLRNGSRPRVYPGPPQRQLDQLPTEEEWRETRRMFSEWQTADQGASRRAVPGTLGLYIRENDNKAFSAEAFLLGNEFAHHHPKDVAAHRSESHADAYLSSSAHHRVGCDAIKPDDGQQSGKSAEYRREAGHQSNDHKLLGMTDRQKQYTPKKSQEKRFDRGQSANPEVLEDATRIET